MLTTPNVLTLSSLILLTALLAPGHTMAKDLSADVAGPDTNNNGVRDDIDTYIDATYKAAAQHAAVLQFAKSQQHVLSVASQDDQETAKKVNQQEMNARHCVLTQFSNPAIDRPIIFEKIVSTTFDIDPRLEAYTNDKIALNGDEATPSAANTCE